MIVGESPKIAPIFRRNLRPKSDTPNLLFKLPPEFRNHIYDLYLSDPHDPVKEKRKREYGVWHEPPLLQTCKQIRSELAPMFFKDLTFRIFDGLNKSALAIDLTRIRSIVELCGPTPFKKVFIFVGTGAWDNLAEILPLLELMRCTGLEPGTEVYEPTYAQWSKKPTRVCSTSSIFRLTSPSHGTLQAVLEQAVEMGRKARDRGWTEQNLAGQFVNFAARARRTRRPQR